MTRVIHTSRPRRAERAGAPTVVELTDDHPIALTMRNLRAVEVTTADRHGNVATWRRAS